MKNNIFTLKTIVAALMISLGVGTLIGVGGTMGMLLATAIIAGSITMLAPELLFYFIITSMIIGQLVRFPVFGQDGALLINDAAIPVLLVAWFVRGIARRSIQIPRASIWIPFFGFMIIMALTGLWNFSSYDQREWLSGILYLIRWLEYAALFLVAYDLMRIPTVQKNVFRLLIASVLIVAVLGFIQLRIFPDFTFMVPQGWDPHIGRLLSTWFDPNFLGGWIAMFSGITLALALLRPSKNFGWWTIFLLLSLAEVLTYSRSGYLGYVAAVFVVTVVRSRVLLFLGAIAIVSTVLFVPRVQERVLGIRSVDQTAQFRIISWNNALDIVSDHPWIGVGYNHYKYAQQQRGFITDTSEHSASGSDSSLLTILVTTGILGTILYVWLYGAICWEFFRTARAVTLNPHVRAIALGSLAAMIGLFVHSQFVNGWLYPHIMETVWILLALTLRERTV